MRVSLSALPLAVTLGVMSAIACSGSPATNPDGGSTGSSTGSAGDDGSMMMPSGPYDGGDPATLMTPMRSFNMDVMPIFTFSCDFSGCHIMSSGMPLEYLGDSGNGSMPPPYSFAKMVYDGIVNKPTIEIPEMMFVKPGDPTNSYLMRKMDNALSDITCKPNNTLEMMFSSAMGMACGTFMPTTSQTILDQSKRDIVREWIAQGAMDN
ncbi:MAG TPA: hypothetical protein VKU41_12480 [Polyangiaceae bacterium]|nr:hypothetical protein [Polyangiaceae bacterium]